MICPDGFDSWKDYFSFSLARNYVATKTEQYTHFPPHVLERVGEVLAKPFLEPLHFFALNIKNPAFIVALSTTAIALTSLAFYPVEFMQIASTLFPSVKKMEPWMLHFGLYATAQSTIIALCLRTLGRLSNPNLLNAWKKREIKALHIGNTPLNRST